MLNQSLDIKYHDRKRSQLKLNSYTNDLNFDTRLSSVIIIPKTNNISKSFSENSKQDDHSSSIITYSNIIIEPDINTNINQVLDKNEEKVDLISITENNLTVKNYICPVCMLSQQSKQMFFMKCNHYYCISCLEEYLKFTVEENKIEKVKCPNHECTLTFTEKELNDILTPQLYDKYVKFEKRYRNEGDRSKIQCPYPDCEEFANVEMNFLTIEKSRLDTNININSEENNLIKTLTPLQQLITKEYKNIDEAALKDKENLLRLFLICIKGHKFCSNCRDLIWHLDRPCNKEEIEFYRFLQGNPKEVKNCPSCGIWTEKLLGCNHITCSKCKFQWCWLCTGEYTLDHYSNPLSKCVGKMFEGVQQHPLLNIHANNLEYQNNVRERRGNRRINQITQSSVSISSGILKFTITRYEHLVTRIFYALGLFLLLLITNYPLSRIVHNYIFKRIYLRYDDDYVPTHLKYQIVTGFINFQIWLTTYFIGMIMTFFVYFFPLLGYIL